jgi:hypothetical protein
MREGGVLARALGCLGGSSSQHGEPLGWGVRQAEVGPHGCPAHLGTAGRRTRVSSPRCLCLGRLCLTLGKVVPACGVDVGACVRLAGVRGRVHVCAPPACGIPAGVRLSASASVAAGASACTHLCPCQRPARAAWAPRVCCKVFETDTLPPSVQCHSESPPARAIGASGFPAGLPLPPALPQPAMAGRLGLRVPAHLSSTPSATPRSSSGAPRVQPGTLYPCLQFILGQPASGPISQMSRQSLWPGKKCPHRVPGSLVGS